MPLVVMPTSAMPGTPRQLAGELRVVGRSVGLPPVSRILLIPAPANSLACSTGSKHGQWCALRGAQV